MILSCNYPCCSIKQMGGFFLSYGRPNNFFLRKSRFQYATTFYETIAHYVLSILLDSKFVIDVKMFY